MSFCLRMLGVNLLSRTAIGVVSLIVRWAIDIVAEFLAPRQLPLSHVRSARICALHPAALIIQEAYAKSLRPVHRACLARCQESSWPKDEILYFLGSSWVLGEIVVRNYLFILVYANFDQCVEIGEDDTKPSI